MYLHNKKDLPNQTSTCRDNSNTYKSAIFINRSTRLIGGQFAKEMNGFLIKTCFNEFYDFIDRNKIKHFNT